MSTANEIREINSTKHKQAASHLTNLHSEINNPCVKEHLLSTKCLDENNYDRDLCSLHFINYQNCRDFWHVISTERRKQGIKPYLPPPGERSKIKADYLKAQSMK